MIVLYALTGGYTELHGALSFLRKIRDDLQYKRLLPAISKPGPKRDKATLKPKDQGLTGVRLLNETERRLRVHEDRDTAAALLVWDDLDCRPLGEGSYAVSVRRFTDQVNGAYQNLTMIFLFADPEIESWFCLQCSLAFPGKVMLCKELKAYRSRYFEDHKAYDPIKDACIQKFSAGFTTILGNHGLSYSKRQDGPTYLEQLDPLRLPEQDNGIRQAVLSLQHLKQQIH